MEPNPKAIEMFLAESDRIAPPMPVLPALSEIEGSVVEGIEALFSQLEAQLQSLRHGLGVVQQKLGVLAELPGHWIEEMKDVARDQGN